LNSQKETWEKTYNEIYQDWASKFSFGAKGELTIQESQEVHRKWMRLGKEASR
jgi:hypothetical protein